MFLCITNKKVPVFLGSSFEFMGGIMASMGNSRIGDPDFLDKLASIKGALIIAGLIYVLFSGLIKIFGYEKVNKLLPPLLTGPIIIVLCLLLSPTALQSAFFKTVEGASVVDWKASLFTICVLATIICVSIFA